MRPRRHLSALARRSGEPPISWLMKLALDRADLISLAAGFTDNETLPVEAVATLAREVLSRPKTARAALQYGSTVGLPQLRHELLRRACRQDQVGSLHDVVVTNGSQQLLYLLTEVLCDSGDIVLVEDPTYFVYLGIVEAMGIRARGFSSIEHLKSQMETLRRRRLLPRLKLLYLVTYYRNPTGYTWSFDEKREAFAIVKHYERAAGHPIYIVEDAAYRDLRFEGDDVPSFLSLDPRHQRVAYANTLTKPFATGLKIGYGILPRALMQPVLRNKANHDFGSSNFLQTILARALAEGYYDRHLPKLVAAYRQKRDAMVEELRNVRFTKPAGGLYVWAETSPRIKTGVKSRFFRRVLDTGVLYVPGEMCYCRDPGRKIPQNGMRLSFATQPVEKIRKGARLLVSALTAIVLVGFGYMATFAQEEFSQDTFKITRPPPTNIFEAVQRRDVKTVQAMIDENPRAVAELDSWGRTPLHRAAALPNAAGPQPTGGTSSCESAPRLRTDSRSSSLQNIGQ